MDSVYKVKNKCKIVVVVLAQHIIMVKETSHLHVLSLYYKCTT